MEKIKQTFYVYNTKGNKPKVEHEFIEDAMKEAQRVAKKEPGQEVQVLSIVVRFIGTVTVAPVTDTTVEE